MLRLVEYGLLAVSLLTVIGLIMMSPRSSESKPVEGSDGEKRRVE